jgi:hypothetical protein
MNAKTEFLFHRRTSSRQLALLPSLLLGATLLCAGDKPWKAKPFQQWDEKELQTILTDSPWVRATTIQRTWLPVSEKDVAPDPQIDDGVRQMPHGAGQRGDVGGGASTNVRAGEGSWRELNVYIYWQSSRVMRAATARQAILHGETVDVDKYASEPQSEYQIILRMEDMTPFARHDEEFVQANTFLQTKKTRNKIAPSHIVYERSQKGPIQDAIFFFRKTDPSGTPTVSDDETDVRFSCKIADSTVHVSFKPREMVDQSGPAL